MSKNTTDELLDILVELDLTDASPSLKEILEPDSRKALHVQYAKTRLEDLISNREKLARIDELKSIKKRATEHCAFKIDQYGSDLDTEDVRLAVPNKKIDERIATLRKELDREEPTHE